MLSKNAQKKLAKAERSAATKLERRAHEKEARKERKRKLKEQGSNRDRPPKKSRAAPNFYGRLVIDLGFDDIMTEKEVKSLTSQLAYSYNANRRALYPFLLTFSSLSGKTFTRLESLSDAGYKRWSKTEWWEDSYERLWTENEETNDGVDDGPSANTQLSLKQRTVYLTADSQEELIELKEDEIYIIGGICDHNRYKNLCLNKARTSQVRSARLPIGRYLANLPTRKVLTVNQVVEILVAWTQTRDWEDALYQVVPKRKFQGEDIAGAREKNLEDNNEEKPSDDGNVQ